MDWEIPTEDLIYEKILKEDNYAELLRSHGDHVLFYRFHDGSDFLIQAVRANAVETAKYLVTEMGFEEDQDSKGRSALHYAADNKNLTLYAFLAEAGWNVLLKDDGGQTPSNLVMKALI